MSSINLLFVGDIIGQPGMDIVQTWLPGLIQKYKADFVVVNGEIFLTAKAALIRKDQNFFRLA